MYNHIIEFAPPPNPRTCSTVMCKSLYEKVMLEFKAIALPPPVTAIETADCSSEANQGLILRSYERLRFQVFVTVMLYFWGGVWRQGCCYEYIGSALKRDTDNHMTSYDVMPIRWISQAVSQTSTPTPPPQDDVPQPSPGGPGKGLQTGRRNAMLGLSTRRAAARRRSLKTTALFQIASQSSCMSSC